MRVKQALPLFCVLALLICSCNINIGDFFSDPDNTIVKDVQRRQFWAFDYSTEQYYIITANLIVDGKYCRMWVEQDADISPDVVKYVAGVFDSEIYPKMMRNFGYYGIISMNGETIAHDTMELADWLGDGDGKLAILLLDILDNYQEGVNEFHTTGYFSKLDLSSSRSYRYSNDADMLYIDISHEKAGSIESNKTIAHEMQHLMNYVTSYLFRMGDTFNDIREMDTWINEGLSAVAEWLYSGRHSEARWLYFNADPSELIQKGNNFFVWGNHTDEHSYAGLDDYATVYLFFHWLRLQAGSSSILYNLITSDENNYRAVIQAANASIKGAEYNDWGTLLKTWLAANYINAPRGPYGYMNDTILRNVKAKTVPEGTQIVNLYPGEGVYGITDEEFLWPNEKKNIRYAGLSNETPWIDDNAVNPGDAILTYNINSDENGSPEEGITSGITSGIDTVLYERRIRALLSQHAMIGMSGAPKQNSYYEAPDPVMTGSTVGIIKIE